MAAVWLCTDDAGREAAVKWLLHGSDTLTRTFAHEIEVLARLDHPGVVRTLGSGTAAGRPWLAMAALAGPDLRIYAEKLRRRPPTERAARTRRIARQVAEALAYLHDQGVIHRDVKPSNVLLDHAGDAVLTDLGIAALAEEATASSGLVGTAAYAAPEAIRGDRPGPAVDQYGLGGTLYVLLTGRRPFEGDTASVLRAHLEERPRPPSELDPTVPADLDALVLRLLAKEPSARFPSLRAAAASLAPERSVGPPLAGRQDAADAVAAALDDVAAGLGVVLRLDGAPGSGRSWVQDLALDAATRRELSCVATEDSHAADAVAMRIATGEAILLVTPVPGIGRRVLLGPLGLGDVRRTVYATAPATPRFAEAAERLHRLTGGNVRMMLELLARHTTGESLDLPEDAEVDAAPWLDGLDLDESAVAAALAALHAPADVATLTRVAQAPAESALPRLVRHGLAVQAGQGWRLGPEALRASILASVPDAEAVCARAVDLVERTAAARDLVREAARADRSAGRRADALAALERAEPAEPAVEAERALLLGLLRWETGDMAGARAAYERAAELAVGPGVRARAAIGVGIVALLCGQLPEAIDRLAEGATEASIAREPSREAVAWLDLCEARAVSGQLADALDAGQRAVRLAGGAGDRTVECAAMRHLGHALLDVGRVDEAYRLLSDATALARALGLEDERIATHTLRARATLDGRPGDRLAAAAALDRILPLLASTAPDPEGFRLHVRATWARAAAQLGDLGMYARAVAEADPSLAGARVTVRLRAEVELVRAHLLAGEPARAAALADKVTTEADAIGAALIAWEARRLAARATHRPLPPPGALADGLDPTTAGMLARR